MLENSKLILKPIIALGVKYGLELIKVRSIRPLAKLAPC